MKKKVPATKDQFYHLLALGEHPYLCIEQTGDGWYRVTQERLLLCFRDKCNVNQIVAVAGESLVSHDSVVVGVELYSARGGVLNMKICKMRAQVEEQRRKYQQWIDDFNKEVLLNGHPSDD